MQPAPSVLAAVITAVEQGDFQEDAFALHGVSWKVARDWLRLGAASCDLHAEDGRPLTWQGDLYQRLRRAEAHAVSSPMRKLQKQAADLGGDMAVKYLKIRRGAAGGGNGSGRLGRDFDPPDASGGADRHLNDDDMLRQLSTSISAAVDAARIRARERALTAAG